jgi:hypothetical protein
MPRWKLDEAWRNDGAVNQREQIAGEAHVAAKPKNT